MWQLAFNPNKQTILKFTCLQQQLSPGQCSACVLLGRVQQVQDKQFRMEFDKIVVFCIYYQMVNGFFNPYQPPYLKAVPIPWPYNNYPAYFQVSLKYQSYLQYLSARFGRWLNSIVYQKLWKMTFYEIKTCLLT